MLEEKKPFKASDGPMTVLIAFVAMLLGQVVFSVILFIFLMKSDNADKATETVNLIAMIAFQGIYLAAYGLYTKRQGIKSSFSIKNRLSIPAVCTSAIIAVICVFCFSGLSQLFEFLLAKTGYVPSELNVNGTLSIVLLVIATVVMAPIGEETIFRAALLSGVERTKIGDLGACMLSGLLFALMHINPSQTVYQFFLGSTAAYVMIKYRNVIAAMIIHALSNLIAVLLSFTDFGQRIFSVYVNQIGHNVIMTIVFCVVLPIVAVALIWFICKILKKYELKKYPDKYNSVTTPRVVSDDNSVKQAELETKNVASSGEEERFFGKKTYGIVLGIYIALTVVLWFFTFISQIKA